MMLEAQMEDGRGRARVSLKAHALTVSFPPAPSFTFDREGRLIGAFVEGRNYRRSLDNRVMEKSRAMGSRRVRRWLEEDERLALFRRVRAAVGEVRACIDGAVGSSPAREAGRAWLSRVLSWDEGRYREDRARFLKVYEPIGILPPDQYLSVVVQVTQGCPWNRCAFCDFYRDRPYRVVSPGALEAHMLGIREFFGDSIGLRRSIFLADANALAMPTEALLPRLASVARAFPSGGAGRICSFIDTFTPGKGPEDYRRMAGLGLRRVYAGLETGDDGLLRFLNKPGSAARAVDVIGAVRAGGVRVGVILLVGAGGDRYAEAHVEGTVRAVNAMGLGAGDMVYFSEVVVHPGSAYARRAREDGIRALSSEAVRAQAQAIRRMLRFPDPARRPKMASYDIREFIY